MPIIEIEGLAKSYRVYQKREGLKAAIGGLFRRQHRIVEAVRGIDLTVEQGEFVAFLGPNGAGKTTTLKLLSGVINPTSGEATVMNSRLPTRRATSDWSLSSPPRITQSTLSPIRSTMRSLTPRSSWMSG